MKKLHEYLNIPERIEITEDIEKTTGWNIIEKNKTVTSNKYDYSGFVDALAMIDGGIYLIYKVESIKPEDLIYSSALVKALEEEGFNIEGRVFLNSKPIFIDSENDSTESDFNAFLSLYFYKGWEKQAKIKINNL